jgi:hypothetical protein
MTNPALTGTGGVIAAVQPGFGRVPIDVSGTGMDRDDSVPKVASRGGFDFPDFDGGRLGLTRDGGSASKEILRRAVSVLALKGDDQPGAGKTMAADMGVIGAITIPGDGRDGDP